VKTKNRMSHAVGTSSGFLGNNVRIQGNSTSYKCNSSKEILYSKRKVHLGDIRKMGIQAETSCESLRGAIGLRKKRRSGNWNFFGS